MISATTCIKRIYLAAGRDGGVLFDPSRDKLFKLTPVAAEMWCLMAKGQSEDDTIADIARRYQVSPGRVRTDLAALLSDAEKMGIRPALIVQISEEPGAFYSSSPVQQTAVHGESASPDMIFCAFLGLVLFDLILALFSVETMFRIVKTWRMRRPSKDPSRRINQVCSAVQKACVWFPHKAVCLQRSAVITCMLRAYGVEAQMVIGVRPMPFLAHAWIEVSGAVVNDRPQVKAFYQKLATY